MRGDEWATWYISLHIALMEIPLKISIILEGNRYMMGNGRITSFWEDRGCKDTLLKMVYTLAADPKAKVVDYLMRNQEMVVLQPLLRRPNFELEIPPIINLLGRLEDCQISLDQEDSRSWFWGLGRRFTMKSCFERIDSSQVRSLPWKESWFSPVPLKTQFFLWTAALGKI